MRNYYKTQSDNDDDKNIAYKSHVSYETVDCFNQTITVNKMYYLADHFASGSLIEEPIEPTSVPIHLQDKTVGLKKLKAVCRLTNHAGDGEYVKSSFMNNI